jgi:D-inositol-3-phosphate glycosyltransferase
MDKSTARVHLGFSEDESIVLYVGRFEPIKGIDRLLEAMAYLKTRKPVRLVIIGGDGPDTSEYQNLQQLSAKFGIQKSVCFIGRVEQYKLPPYYSAADALVIPSYYESFGLVGLESMACGTPVVAFDVGAMRYLVRDGESGQIVADATPRSLAQAIEKVLSADGSKKLSGDRIRASVLKFGWSHVAAAVINEYGNLFGNMNYEDLRNCSAKTSFL